MKPAIYILLASALTGWVCFVLGAGLLTRLRLALYREERRYFAFVLGAACLSNLVFFLTAAHLAYKGVFIAVGLIIVAYSIWRRPFREPAPSLPPVPLGWRLAFWGLWAVYGYIYLSQALAPEVSADAVSYHLSLVARYLRQHSFGAITTDLYANLSAGMEMLFLFAFSIGRHSAAAMCEFLFLMALPVGILLFARRSGNPAAGVVAAMLVYLSPVAGRAGTVAYNDVAGATVVFSLFYVLEVWREQGGGRWLVLAGVLAGFGYAIKYTLGVGCIYALAIVLWSCLRQKRAWLKPTATLIAAASLWVAPWMIKNVVTVANPVSPFANHWFPNPYVSEAFEHDYRTYLRTYDGVKPSEIPLEVTLRGSRTAGLLGPIFLLAPLGLIALRWPLGRRLLLAALVFLLTYPTNIGTRFLLPALPFVSLAMGLAVSAWPPAAAALLAAHAVLSWCTVVPRYADRYAWFIRKPEWRAALRRIPEEEFVRRFVPDYDIGAAIEQNVPPHGRILTASMGNQAYHRREILVPYQASSNAWLYDTLSRAANADMRTEMRDILTFAPRTARSVTLIEVNALNDPLTIGEIRFFHQGVEIPREQTWLLHASVNPWFVQRAFDNSPVTVWNSDVAARAGMSIRVDFPSPVTIDRIVVDVPHALRDAILRVELDGHDAGAQFTQDVIPLAPRMRRAAMEELKANGVEWLVFRDGEYLAADLAARYRQWGIRQVAERNGYRLWRIE